MEDILLSLSSPPDIDLELFQLWVEGTTIEDAQKWKIEQMRKMHQAHTSSHPSSVAPTTPSNATASTSKSMTIIGLEFPRMIENYLIDFTEILRHETVDQYRCFQTLEHFLMQPHLLKSQSLCAIPVEMQKWAIDQYWSLNDSLVREVLNKRFVKSRKDLEEISETTYLNLRSITRQLENIKRVYGSFEDMPNLVGSIYVMLSHHYLLPHVLSRRYACIIFLLYSKFNISSKRRMLRIPSER